MNKVNAILLFILLCPILLMAQGDKYSCFGLRLGLGMSTLSGLDGRTYLPVEQLGDLSTGYRFSWDVGASVQLGWGDGYVVQTELWAGMQGARLKGVYKDGMDVDELSISNVQLTVTYGKKVYMNDNLRLIITAGPYIGYDMTAEGDGYSDGNGISDWDSDYDEFGMTKSATTKSVTIDTDNERIFREVDFGMTLIAGIETNGFQIAFSPQFGLTNLSRTNPKVSHRVYKLAVTYYF
ncbi:PorT family protein [Dysgonomonas sp. Marseille-P4677]|uniref:outer membrane beta-barrel protein n=1 Tax=Dysgonomonas sp. Marseille-P4677 TaxID=2364790 RepID=UPI0019148712|nr:outer membrane beta-barrel protein [Dysgonomonas sp. Marseille-P4677]MBK5722544.1 PorT family protein [Dysgonomonas sp. Marseille-P4677]